MTFTDLGDANLSSFSWNQRGMTTAAEKNAKAMWTFLTRRYNRNQGKMRTMSVSGSVTSSNYDPLDDDDDLSRMSMTSTEKNAIAVPRIDQTVEDSLSKELMKLSMNDRQQVEEEVHGVHCMCNFSETPQFLGQKLREFDTELNAIKNSERRRRKRARARKQHQGKKNGGGNVSCSDDDVLRNVIRIREFLKVVDEEDNTECTEESAQSRSSFASITTSFPEDVEVDEGELKKRSCWVNDPDVRLRFLRCELFNTKKAVKRFVTFLDFAQELYGDFIADRPMRLSDMKTREEKRAMANIQFHVLPFRDRSGRRVFVSVGSCGYDVEPLLRIKILWYMIWIASEDIETQRKGLVIIGWPCDEIISGSNSPMSEDDTRSSDGSAMGGIGDSVWERNIRPNIANVEGIYQVKSVDGLPIRIAALHFCIQNRPVYRILNSLFYFTLDSSYKSRYKVHIGEPLEIRYKLQGYGIPVDLLPITHTMTLKRQSHLQWINFRKYVEQGENGSSKASSKNSSRASLNVDPADIVECPRSYDVIIGKAKYTNNPGNVFYRSLIEATHDEHIALSKKDKVEMTWRIVKQMDEINGRFLEMNKQLKVWVHIKDRNVMRQKVAQSYKEYKRNAHVVRTKRQQEQKEKTYCGDKRQRTDETIPLALLPDNSCMKGCTKRCTDDDDNNSSSLFTLL